MSLKVHKVTETQRHRLSYRQIIQSCIALPLWCVRRGNLSTFQRAIETQTLIHTQRHRLSQRQVIQGCLAPPPLGVRDATANCCQDIKHTIYKTSKPKPKLTPPSQTLRRPPTPPLLALRKRSIGPQHSKVQRGLVTPSVVLTQLPVPPLASAA